jgi:hypothetical protein
LNLFLYADVTLLGTIRFCRTLAKRGPQFEIV